MDNNLVSRSGNIRSIVVFIFLIIIHFNFKGFAQSLGDPIINETFGAGITPGIGPALPFGVTNYIYTPNVCAENGKYTVATSSGPISCFGSWHVTSDHTGDKNGYMMIVDASFEPGIFYTKRVSGSQLCANTTYELAAWIANLLIYIAKTENYIKPNITFTVTTSDGKLLAPPYNTGDIAAEPPGSVSLWKHFSTTFTAPPNGADIIVTMTNNAPGGNGNDLILDDITFRPYGTPVSIVFNQSATDQTICAGTSKTFNINTTSKLATGYLEKLQMFKNGIWVDQTLPDTVSSFKIISPITAGVYRYRIVSAVTGNINITTCVIASNELTLTVEPLPEVYFMYDGACLGDTTFFQGQNHSDAAIIKQWHWDFGDGQTSSQQNPAHLYVQGGKYNVQLIVTTDSGCTASAIPDTIRILAKPIAAFSYLLPACESRAVTFVDQSTITDDSITQRLWDYGDGLSEIKKDGQPFQHVYTLMGSYTVTLVVSTASGCTTSTIQTVTVNPLPKVNFGMPDVCLTDATASFTDSTVVADQANNRLNYFWNFGDQSSTLANPNTSTLKNPTHQYTYASTYQVSLTVTTDKGCSVTKAKTFIVNGASPIAKFNVLDSDEPCSARDVIFTNQSTVDFGNITKIEWYFDYDRSPMLKETDNSPYFEKLYRHSYPLFHKPDSINYRVHMVAYSGISCVSVAEKSITQLAKPQLIFPLHAPVCQDGNPVQLSAAELSGIEGSGCSSGPGVTPSGMFNPLIVGAGTFSIRYIFIPKYGCSDTINQKVTVNSNPSVIVGPDITILEGETTKLQAKASTNGLIYLWSPTTGLNDASSPNPLATTHINTIYTLTVRDSTGCTSSKQIKVTVLKVPIVPNTFTPNGDGVNDTWIVKYLDTYTNASVQIFNRNGQKVFSSIGYPVAWDGKYNGVNLPVGVYYYIINPKHGRGLLSGSVAIIR